MQPHPDHYPATAHIAELHRQAQRHARQMTHPSDSDSASQRPDVIADQTCRTATAVNDNDQRTTPRRPGEIARRTRVVREHDIELFSELTGDRNPLHYDQAAASRSRFGGIIVQGGVTSGLLNAVVAEDLPGHGSVFLHVDWSFKAPVRPGDEITAEVEVLATRKDKPLTTITNQDGTVVLDGRALVWTEQL